jgi:hypothetical protein
MINTKIIWQILSIGEHLLVLALLIAVHILYRMNVINKCSIRAYRSKVKDLVAEIVALEKEKNERR